MIRRESPIPSSFDEVQTFASDMSHFAIPSKTKWELTAHKLCLSWNVSRLIYPMIFSKLDLCTYICSDLAFIHIIKGSEIPLVIAKFTELHAKVSSSSGYTGWYSIPSNFLSCSPAQRIEVFWAGLLSSAWYGNIALAQCMLCINQLRASCWFDYIQPL
jgi:hypothetical protein